MTHSSKYYAKTWPHPRHDAFELLLRKSNGKWFSERGFRVNNKMTYLLECWEDWPNNIILPEVARYIKDEQARRNAEGDSFPIHKYIHHGLSSQAMLFNLIGPLVIDNNLTSLKTAFEANGIQWPGGYGTAKFEVENRNIFHEDAGQPTSIDLVIQSGDSIGSLFIEAKLVEREFGGCSVFSAGDCDGRNPSDNFARCYLHHLGRQYWILLNKHGFLEGLAGTSPICPMAMYYQFFRELVFAIESGGDFVLLYDQRNPAFYCGNSDSDRGLMPFLFTFVPDQLKHRIHSISIQQIVSTYTNCCRFIWLDDFVDKYGLTQN